MNDRNRAQHRFCEPKTMSVISDECLHKSMLAQGKLNFKRLLQSKNLQ